MLSMVPLYRKADISDFTTLRPNLPGRCPDMSVMPEIVKKLLRARVACLIRFSLLSLNASFVPPGCLAGIPFCPKRVAFSEQAWADSPLAPDGGIKVERDTGAVLSSAGFLPTLSSSE